MMRRKKSTNPHFVINNFNVNPSWIYLKWHYDEYEHNGKKKKRTIMYSTREKIDLANWNKGLPIKSDKIDYERLMAKLDDIKLKAVAIRMENPGFITPDKFKALLDIKMNIKPSITI